MRTQVSTAAPSERYQGIFPKLQWGVVMAEMAGLGKLNIQVVNCYAQTSCAMSKRNGF